MRREIVGGHEGEEALLELGACRGLGVAGEEGRERALASRGSLHQLVERVAGGEAQHLGLREGAFEGTEGKLVGEVEQRARGGRDRDPVVAGGVARVEGAGPVDDEPSMPRGVAGQHVDRPTPRRSKAPERGGRLVAEDRAVAAREHGREIERSAVDRPVAHGVHPAMKGVKPAGAHPPVDRARRNTRRQQLRPAHDPMLVPGDPGDQHVRRRGWDELTPYIDVNPSHPLILATHAARITPL